MTPLMFRSILFLLQMIFAGFALFVAERSLFMALCFWLGLVLVTTVIFHFERFYRKEVSNKK